MSRGKAFNRKDLEGLVEKLRREGLKEEQLHQISGIDPSRYIGNAAEMARNLDKYL